MGQFIDFARQTCDDFIALRRGREFLGANELTGGSATIGGRSVFALLYCKNPHSGNSRSSAPASVRASGYQTAQHLIQLAHKFTRPVVVFTTSQTSLQGAYITEPHEAQGFSNHIFSQCRLEAPIILAVLSRWSSGDIFGAWLADKILALEQTRFSMNVFDEGEISPIQVRAPYLLRRGVIDQTVPMPAGRIHDSQVMMPDPKQLRAALRIILEDVSHVSPKELMIRRKERQERISEISSRTFGLGKPVRIPSSNGSSAPI
jgi:acetyl-CoA carboxylase alpha subunit